MKFQSYWHVRRTAGGFLLETALLTLALWLPTIWPGTVSPAIQTSIAVSVAYLLWTTGAAAWQARVGFLRAVGFVVLYLIGSFYLVNLPLYLLGFVISTPIGWWELPFVALEFMLPAAVFAVSLGIVWMATVCLPRPDIELMGRTRTRFGRLLPLAMIVGLADIAVPWSGGMTLEQFEMSSNGLSADELLSQAWLWAWPWRWPLPLGALLFVAHERALTVTLSRLYGSVPAASERRRARQLRWLLTVPAIVAILLLYWVNY